MTQVALFVLLGLGSGALIAALGTALVVGFRGSGTVNMSVGAIALAGAYTFYSLRTNGELWLVRIPGLPDHIPLGRPWATGPAVVAAVLVSLVIGVVFDLVVLRPLRTAAPLARLLASLGLLIVIQAAVGLRFGSQGQQASAVFPDGPDQKVTLFGVTTPTNRLWLAATIIVVGVAIAALYRWTRFGITTRAAAESETLAELAGLSPTVLSALNSGLAGAVCGLFGALAASLVPLDPVTMPLIVVPALAAALLGRFTGVVTTVVAGLAMGAAQSVLVYLQSKPWFPTSAGQPVPGVTDLLFFLAVIGAVLLRGSRLPQRGALRERALPHAPAARRLAPGAVLALAAVVVGSLVLPYGPRQGLINSLIGVVVCLSLVVITGYVGQVSLIQIALAGVSGFVVSNVATHAGIGVPWGPLLGIAAAVALGSVIGASALRVRGVNLAIVSVAGAACLQTFGFQNPVWGGGTDALGVPEPHVFGVDIGTRGSFPVNGGDPPSPLFALIVGVVAVAVAVGVVNLRRSQLGKRMLAVRSDERAAAAAGIGVSGTKLVAFALSSAIAGVAGVLYAYDFGSVGAARFDVVLALTFIAFAYIGGITTVLGAVVGGIGVSGGVASYLLDTYTGITAQYQALIGGFALMLAITKQPDGIAGAIVARRTRRAARTGGTSGTAGPPADPARAADRGAGVAGRAAGDSGPPTGTPRPATIRTGTP